MDHAIDVYYSSLMLTLTGVHGIWSHCMPWKLSFVLKIPSTIDISIHDSCIQRNTGDGNSQLPDELKQGIAIMEKLNFVSVLQNGVPFPFCQDFLYTVVVTASLKRIPETELQDQKPPIIHRRIKIRYRISFDIELWIFDIKEESSISNLLNRYQGI